MIGNVVVTIQFLRRKAVVQKFLQVQDALRSFLGLLQGMKRGQTQYTNKKRNITYNFKPIDNAITQ